MWFTRRLLFRLMFLLALGVSAWWVFFTDHIPTRGVYPASCEVEDKQAPGGFGRWDNLPKDLKEQDWGKAGELSLVAFPDESVTCAGRRGFAVRIVNRSDAIAEFSACDSWLYLSQEALDRTGNWRRIELLPESWCGNSYHRVFLARNQYWEFPAHQYSGTFKTHLRFRLDQGKVTRSVLDLGGERKHELVSAGPGGRIIYSNEFEGWVNESLLALANLK